MTTPASADRSGAMTTERRIVRGLLADRLDENWPSADEISGERMYALLAATSAVAVFALWPDDPEPSEFPILAQRVSDQVTGESKVPPAMVEAAIRGALGEYDLIEGLSGAELMPAYLLLIKTAAHSVMHDLDRRDAAVTEVLEALSDA